MRLNTAFPPMGSEVQIRPEQFEATQYPLLSIISLAHGISRIEGAPEWLQTQRYDIRARAPKPSSRAEVLQMLQTLLAERFRLKARRETRTMDVYGLIVAKPDSLGPGMHPVKVDCETNQITEGPDPKIFPGSRPRCGNALVSTRMVSGPVLITRRQAAVTMKTRGRPLRRRATCVRQNWPDRNVRRGAEIHPRYAAQSVPGPPVEGTTTRRVAQGRHQAAARPRPPLRAGTGRIPRHRFDSKARLELAATRPCPAAAALCRLIDRLLHRRRSHLGPTSKGSLDRDASVCLDLAFPLKEPDLEFLDVPVVLVECLREDVRAVVAANEKQVVGVGGPHGGFQRRLAG